MLLSSLVCSWHLLLDLHLGGFSSRVSPNYIWSEGGGAEELHNFHSCSFLLEPGAPKVYFKSNTTKLSFSLRLGPVCVDWRCPPSSDSRIPPSCDAILSTHGFQVHLTVEERDGGGIQMLALPGPICLGSKVRYCLFTYLLARTQPHWPTSYHKGGQGYGQADG